MVPVSRRAARRAYAAEFGPCYDLCMCRWCWRGWGLSFRERLRLRIRYLLDHHVLGRPWG